MKLIAWVIFGGLCIYFSFHPLNYILADGPTLLLRAKSAELLQNHFYNISFYTHISLGGIALLVGWLQFIKKLRLKLPKLHRSIGKIYVASVLISGVPGFYIALHASGGLSPKLGFSIGAILWIIFTFRGYTTIREGDVETHKKMMLYSYAGTFGAVTLRLWLPFLIAICGDFISAYQIVAWLSWLPNVCLVYLINNKIINLNHIKNYYLKNLTI